MERKEMNSGNSIVITGCCGTIGHALLRELAERGYSDVIGIDNNESGLFALEQEFRGKFLFRFGDLRDEYRMTELFQGADTVLHTAALKHVMPCEFSPAEAVKTNILGVANVITAARRNGVKRVLFTSSDKAANPTNVMGTTKLMGERLMTAAQASPTGHPAAQEPLFFSTRFGNVLGSHGSVFPLFRRQIAAGGPVTLTDPEMTRFVMSTREAVSMVLDTVELARGGEVIVSKMHSLRIADLAAVMIERLAPLYGHKPEDIPVKIIGPKPGEKLYEELLTEEESHRSLELDRFFVILPAFRDYYDSSRFVYPNARPHTGGKVYHSNVQTLMTRAEIADYLEKNNLLTEEME